jgi:hypothetical protein
MSDQPAECPEHRPWRRRRRQAHSRRSADDRSIRLAAERSGSPPRPPSPNPEVARNRASSRLSQETQSLVLLSAASGGEPPSLPQWNGGYGSDSGPSRGGLCTRAFRPTATSTVAINNVRSTSTPAGRNAQIAAVPDRSNRPQTAVSPMAWAGFLWLDRVRR